MHEWINTVIYGIVEGLTEFLPISSTGHLILTENILKDSRSEFFLVGIQSGAVLAIVLIYWRKLLDMIIHLSKPANRDYAFKLFTAFCITGFLALVMKKMGFTLPENPLPIAWATFIGALVIFFAEYMIKRNPPQEQVGWLTAVVIGLSQVIAAIFPGSSRSGSTIISGMLCGSSRLASTEFSFLLGIPTMFAATGYTFYELLKKQHVDMRAELDQFALGFIVSTVVAFLVVKWLLGYVRSHSFIPFAWYRLLLGLGLLAWYYMG